MAPGNPDTFRVDARSTGDPLAIAAIVATMQRAAAAVVRGDAAGVASMFADEEAVTSFDFMQPGITSVADIRANVEDIAREAVGAVVMHYPHITVHVVSADFAWSLAYGEFAMNDRDGRRTDLSMSVTDVWRKIGGRWRAVHEHTSLPIDMKTGSAIMKQQR